MERRKKNPSLQFEFGRLTIAEEKGVKRTLRRLPFLLSDALTSDTGFYFGKGMIPTTQALQTLQYLSDILGNTAGKLKVKFFDPKSRIQFPLPAYLFKNGKWKFNTDSSVELITSKTKKRERRNFFLFEKK